jgi:predicted house-cleaning noncanonical NTP pyrophosphatase (MazG superfamily)
VPANAYGIVVEGPYDLAILRELIPRILGRDVPVIPRPCFAKVIPNKNLLTFLRDLQDEMQERLREKTLKNLQDEMEVWRHQKALVIRDSGGKDPKIIEEELTRKVQERRWAFSHEVHVCIIRQEVETWLLADVEEGINAVARKRGGRVVAEVQGTLEEIEYPKERLKELLSEAKLEYTDQVCAEIARLLRLDTLSYRCPSFRTFKQRVVDC